MMVDYLVGSCLIDDTDDIHKNYYLYCDTNDGSNAAYDYANPEGTNEWTMLPWDKDLTFGFSYGETSYSIASQELSPFLGDSDHPRYDATTDWNLMFDALLDTPAFKQMYLCRLRTVMDELLQPPGTPNADRNYEQQLNVLYAEVSGDTTAFPSGQSQTTALATGLQRHREQVPRSSPHLSLHQP